MRKDKGSGNNTDKFRRKLKRKRIYYSLLAVLFGIMLIPIAATGLGFQKYFYSVLYQNAVTENCCFSKRMRKVFRKNAKSMLQNCNKKAKRKGRLQRVKKPM